MVKNMVKNCVWTVNDELNHLFPLNERTLMFHFIYSNLRVAFLSLQYPISNSQKNCNGSKGAQCACRKKNAFELQFIFVGKSHCYTSRDNKERASKLFNRESLNLHLVFNTLDMPIRSFCWSKSTKKRQRHKRIAIKLPNAIFMIRKTGKDIETLPIN